MRQASVLLITDVQEKEASDGRNYKVVTAVQTDTTITFAPVLGANGHVTMEKQVLPTIGNPRNFTIWSKDSDAIGGRLNYSYGNYRKNVSLPGAFVTRDVESYDIPTGKLDDLGQPIMRSSTRATVPVFGDNTSPEWEVKVEEAFRKNRFTLTTANSVKTETPVQEAVNDDIPF